MTLRAKHALLPAAAGLLALSACTDPTGANDNFQRTRTGAFLGGMVGAIAGAQMTGDDPLRGAIVGGAIGAGTGAVIGNILDRQAAELRQSLDGRVTIINRGNELVVVMPNDLLFAFDSAEVSPGLQGDLRELAASLQRYPGTTVEVEGHTDGVGSADYNLRLSRERAENVRTVLVGAGVDPVRVVATGRGEDVLPEGVSAIPQENPLRRRVEIYIRLPA